MLSGNLKRNAPFLFAWRYPSFPGESHHALQPARQYRPVRFRTLPRHHDLRRRRRECPMGPDRQPRPEGRQRDRRPLDRRRRQFHRHGRRLFLRPVRATARPVAEGPRRQALGRRHRHQGAWRDGAGPNDRGASRGHIMDSVDGSLERLQLDHIDLYQIHGTDTVTPIDETLRALDDLVARARSATSASPTGRPGASPRRWASPTARATPASRPCRPTTPSPAATSSARSCR